MKKLLSLVALAAALFVFTPTSAEAGSYRSRIIGKCQHCNGNIYSHYRPVRYSHGRAIYGWVPSYHSKCAASYARSRSIRSYSRPSVYTSRQYYSRPGVYSRSRFSSGPGFNIRSGGGGTSFSFSFGGNRYCR